MNWPGNFLNQKLRNLADDTDFNKNFHIQSKGTLYLKRLYFCKIMFTFLIKKYLILNV